MAQVQLVKFIFTRVKDGIIPSEINNYLDRNYVSIHCNIIDGVKYLVGSIHKVIPDRLEAGSFIIVAAATSSSITTARTVAAASSRFASERY